MKKLIPTEITHSYKVVQMDNYGNVLAEYVDVSNKKDAEEYIKAIYDAMSQEEIANTVPFRILPHTEIKCIEENLH